MDREYNIAFEIAGPAAMFMRPDTGSTPISYPAPTYSAAKGMFDAVLRLRSIYVKPLWVEVCKPVRYERYVTNYHGPLRKPGTDTYQLMATILTDVCYRIYGKVIVKRSTRGKGRIGTRERKDVENHAKAFIAEFYDRLANFQNFYVPCLGWKEFVPNYFGPIREKDIRGQPIQPDATVDEAIPSMLFSMWRNRKLAPSFVQNARIKQGVLLYQKGGDGNVE
jgi:CRISPR-associated protein Cas5d